MARKTFISYKYSDAWHTRDRLLRSLGSDVEYYQGETSESPNLTDNKTSTIKKKLSDMLYGTSVTLVILSPNITKSNWVNWEVGYSIRKETRNGRQSQSNGILLIQQEINGSYDWMNVYTYEGKKRYLEILRYLGLDNKTQFITERQFLINPKRFIENAYNYSK